MSNNVKFEGFDRRIEKIKACMAENGIADLEEAIDSNNLPREEDEEWVKALKQIVAGMKEEAFILLKSGKTPGDIEIWLDGRQNMESAYRQQIIESDIPEAQKRKTLKALGL